MLIIEVDDLDAEAAQTRLARLSNVVRPAVDAKKTSVARSHVPEFRCDDRAIASVAERPSHERLVRANTVHVRGVEEIDAELQRPVDDGDGRGVLCGAVKIGHAHAAEADGRDAELRVTKQ